MQYLPCRATIKCHTNHFCKSNLWGRVDLAVCKLRARRIQSHARRRISRHPKVSSGETASDQICGFLRWCEMDSQPFTVCLVDHSTEAILGPQDLVQNVNLGLETRNIYRGLKPKELKPKELKPKELKPNELKPTGLKPKESMRLLKVFTGGIASFQGSIIGVKWSSSINSSGSHGTLERGTADRGQTAQRRAPNFTHRPLRYEHGPQKQRRRG